MLTGHENTEASPKLTGLLFCTHWFTQPTGPALFDLKDTLSPASPSPALAMLGKTRQSEDRKATS